MWLRDRLPKELPVVRSIIYGYDTSLLASESVQSVEDLAISLIEKMKAIGMSRPSARPALVIAHSLGGIVLKQAIAMMARSLDSSRVIVDVIRAVICFGVPNKGMQISHLLPMVDNRPNDNLVHLLSPQSDYLHVLDEHFSGVALHRRIRIFSVYETKRSPTSKVRILPFDVLWLSS